MKIPVSVIIMTKNEERDLPKCLRSVSDFAEVFVVDSNSTDRTCRIARDCSANVVGFTWNGRYPKKKQWCLENLPFTYDWVLYVDADEEVGPALSQEIRQLVAGDTDKTGFFVEYDYVFMNRVLKHGHRTHKLVLFQRQRGRFAECDDLGAENIATMEVECHYQPLVEGAVGVLRNRMTHADHDSLFQFFARHNTYSDWEAVLLARHKLGALEQQHLGMRGTAKAIFAKLPFRGVVAFLHSYVLKLGFLDGSAGFHYALARAFYFWQIGVKFSELQQSPAAQRVQSSAKSPSPN
jgi:glycosyltransferase involved in cell wall biosynthesis